jgi:hypothetical protein
VRATVLVPSVLALLLTASPTLAQEGGAVFTTSLGGGAELGLDDDESAGVGEFEVTAGWDFGESGLRPEVGIVFGLQPDTHAGLRAGFRYLIRDTPFQLRAAMDWSSARNEDLWFRRFVLLGVAAEFRITREFGLFAEFDSGIPLRDEAGVPLLFRGGASLRF